MVHCFILKSMVCSELPRGGEHKTLLNVNKEGKLCPKVLQFGWVSKDSGWLSNLNTLINEVEISKKHLVIQTRKLSSSL